MSQVAIREYDAKNLFAQATHTSYDGHCIDIEQKDRSDAFLSSALAQSGELLVVKPDMLFGKRGKYGLVGVKLTPEQVVERVRSKSSLPTTIKDKTALLTIFLVERFVAHTDEYYIALKTERDSDIMYFSSQGGIDVEENWDQVDTISIPVGCKNPASIIQEYIKTHNLPSLIVEGLGVRFDFFRSYGFSYLEVNPFCVDAQGNIVNLDMVAKVDNCESFKQPAWNHITRTKAFGEDNYPAEDIIKTLDEKTGASLKLSILNPHGDIWLLLGGGGASVITMDTLANHGLLDRVANYGELSGNPDYDNNKAYIEQILSMMANNSPMSKVSRSESRGDKGGLSTQYLCMIGGIANFTRIDQLCQAFVKVLEENLALVKSKNIHIVCRRGGVNDTQGLALVQQFCDQKDIPCQIFDGSVYLTEWVKMMR